MQDHRLVGAVNPRHEFDHIRVVPVDRKALFMSHVQQSREVFHYLHGITPPGPVSCGILEFSAHQPSAASNADQTLVTDGVLSVSQKLKI